MKGSQNVKYRLASCQKPKFRWFLTSGTSCKFQMVELEKLARHLSQEKNAPVCLHKVQTP